MGRKTSRRWLERVIEEAGKMAREGRGLHRPGRNVSSPAIDEKAGAPSLGNSSPKAATA